MQHIASVSFLTLQKYVPFYALFACFWSTKCYYAKCYSQDFPFLEFFQVFCEAVQVP